ncbi:MAG: heavy metal sensor histidine kinase [Bdellovibrionales bacterium]
MTKSKRWFNYSLSRQLMIYSFAFTYLMLVIFWTVLYLSLKHDLQRQDEGLIKDRIHTISSLIISEDGPSDRLSRRIEKEWLERNYERILVRVLDSQRHVVVETPRLSQEHAKVLQSLDDDAVSNRGHDHVWRLDTGANIYETAIAEAAAGPRRYLIEIALERTSEQRLLSRFTTFFIYLLLAGGAASLWIGRSIVKIALKPIRDVSEMAARINSDHLDERFQNSSLPVEFHEVAASMNGMLDRLSDSFVRLTRFSEDMAHELRTPVNNLLGTMEVALAHERSTSEYRNILGSGIEECERLKRIIESLLFIARSSVPNQSIEKQKLGLAEELKDIVSFYEVSAEERQIRLCLEADEDLCISGERTHLQRCIGNLLSNSIRHSSENSSITISAHRESHSVVVRVIDHGCGMPKAALERIGERFFRIESSRSKLYGGTGLGLSIAKSIVEMHGGRMEVTSQEGLGTTVQLDFPS